MSDQSTCLDGGVCFHAPELAEARSEIGRHHRYFARIRQVLDDWDCSDKDACDAVGALREIRGIVG